MYVHTPTLGRLVRRALFKPPFNLTRCAYAAGFGLTQSLLGVIVMVGRALDRLQYPELAELPVPAPLFVVATPRSGTTYLHHLLELDEERFFSCKLYQTIFPSIALEQGLARAAALDADTGRLFGRLVDAIDRRIFTEWDAIHRVTLRSAEEDENLFVGSLTSPAIYLLFPFIRELPEFVEITRLGGNAVRRVAEDYRETLRRWVYLEANARTPLIKNVLLPSRLAVSDRAFPEARYVHVVRDPREAIPSAMSMFHAMWQSHSPDIAANSPETRALADMFLHHYRLLCEEGRKRPPDRWAQVRYEELVADPVGAVERIYEAFGLPLSAAYRARLEHAASEARRFKSQHRYDLADYGLTEADLRAGLADFWPGATGRDEHVAVAANAGVTSAFGEAAPAVNAQRTSV
jgi:hypothetical protein